MPFSTFGGIEMAKNSLYAHQQALNVTGHNIANVNSEGYTRQRVIMGALDPLTPPIMQREVTAGMMGTGVEVTSVERLRDAFIDARVSKESTSLGRWEKEENLTHQIELIYNEPSDNSLRSVLDQFWNSLEDLSNNPESQAVRATVRERGRALTDTLNHMYQQLQAIGGSGGVGGGENAIDAELSTAVININGWAKEIAGLNVQIKNAEGAGDNPNDLYDRRDNLVKQISELVDVNTTDSEGDEYRVTIGGLVLVQGSISHELEFKRDPLDNKQYVYWEGREKLQIRDGAMAALLNVRDEVLPYHFDRLNEFAVSFTQAINDIHKFGFGLDGETGRDFFAALPTLSAGVQQVRGNPQSMPPTNTYVMQADLPLNGDPATTAVENYGGSPIGTGPQRLTLNGYSIAYNADTDSLNDLVARINESGSGISAAVDASGRLILAAGAAADYTITQLDDTGNLLHRLGILQEQGVDYDGTTAGEVNLNSGAELTRPPAADVATSFRISDAIEWDLDAIAAATGIDSDLDGIPDISKGPGNSDNALDLAELKTAKVLSERTASFNDFYNALLAKLGTDAQVAKSAAANQTALVDNLKALQDAVSGVSLDEEMTNLIKYQRGFEAASRFINIYDGMLDRIINGLKTS